MESVRTKTPINLCIKELFDLKCRTIIKLTELLLNFAVTKTHSLRGS